MRVFSLCAQCPSRTASKSRLIPGPASWKIFKSLSGIFLIADCIRTNFSPRTTSKGSLKMSLTQWPFWPKTMSLTKTSLSKTFSTTRAHSSSCPTSSLHNLGTSDSYHLEPESLPLTQANNRPKTTVNLLQFHLKWSLLTDASKPASQRSTFWTRVTFFVWVWFCWKHVPCCHRTSVMMSKLVIFWMRW